MRTTLRRTLAASMILLLVPAATPAVAARAVPAPTPRGYTAGMAVLAGSTIVRPDGTRIRLALPRGAEPMNAVEVPTGFLVSTLEGHDHNLWHFPHRGTPGQVRIGSDVDAGIWDVTGDGATVVATTGTVNVLAAYAVPSLRQRSRIRFAGPAGSEPTIRGITGQRVVLVHADDRGAGTVAIWDLRLRRLTRTPGSIYSWGVSRDGRMLYRLDSRTSACVDLVAIARSGLVPVTRTGLCGRTAERLIQGDLSPDGASAVVFYWLGDWEETPPSLVRTADLHAGRWRPTPLPDTVLPPLFWDTGTTFITVGGFPAGYRRCQTNGRCVRLVLSHVPNGEGTLVRRVGL
ncbi:hypothetical protein GCM10009682_59950 [Luedemannella flava]|uniref:WD40 repeat domain-containing protein n=1 Tax=Luedemannella flava TaxID=349316 RepID=A0ABN2MNS1_9ACTN